MWPQVRRRSHESVDEVSGGADSTKKMDVKFGTDESINRPVYVAVGVDPKENKNNLKFVLDLFKNHKKLFIFHVLEPAKKIPSPTGGKAVESAKVEPAVLKAFRDEEKKKTMELLDEYVKMCAKKKVKAEIILVEAEDVKKGIAEAIVSHGIEQLVMGGAADKRHAKNMRTPTSAKAIYVNLHAPASCQIWFVCKGKHVCTRNSDGSVDSPMSWHGSSPHAFSASDRSHSLPAANGLNKAPAFQRSFAFTDNDYSEDPDASESSVTDQDISQSQQESSMGETDESVSLKSDGDHKHEHLKDALAEGAQKVTDGYTKISAKLHKKVRKAKDKAKMLLGGQSQMLMAGHEAGVMLTEHENHQRESQWSEETMDEEEEDEDIEEIDDMQEDVVVDAEEQGPKEAVVLEKDEQGPKEAVVIIPEAQMEAVVLEKESEEVKEDVVQKQRDQEIEETVSPMETQFKITEYSVKQLEEATNSFDNNLKMEEGQFGNFYKGKINGCEVAILVLKQDNLKKGSEFIKEVAILSIAKHPNLLSLLGYTVEPQALVYEYISHSVSLQDKLQDKDSSSSQSWVERIQIIRQTRSALLSLRSSDMIHGSLEPKNIHVDFIKMEVKVGQMGLLKLYDIHHGSKPSFNSDTGPMAYVDPEYIANGVISPSMDVYSFGVILLQLITRKDPKCLELEKMRKALANGDLSSVLDTQTREWPVDRVKELVELSLKCCEKDPTYRPGIESNNFEMLDVIAEARIEPRERPGCLLLQMMEGIMSCLTSR